MRLVTVPVVCGTIRIDARSRMARVVLNIEAENSLPVVVELDDRQSRQLVVDITQSLDTMSLEVYQELLAGWAVPR